MSNFWLGVYDFFSNNIAVLAIVLALGVIATILETSKKITTPIASLIKKIKDKKEAKIEKEKERLEREKKRDDDIQAILKKLDEIQNKEIHTLEEKVEEIDHIVGHPSTPLTDVFDATSKHLVKIDKKLDKISDIVFENEKDRIKAELSSRAAQCRRGIPIYPEEFIHIQEIYDKYTNVLHANSRGTEDYETIKEFYESQEFLKIK